MSLRLYCLPTRKTISVLYHTEDRNRHSTNLSTFQNLPFEDLACSPDRQQPSCDFSFMGMIQLVNHTNLPGRRQFILIFNKFSYVMFQLTSFRGIKLHHVAHITARETVQNHDSSLDFTERPQVVYRQNNWVPFLSFPSSR